MFQGDLATTPLSAVLRALAADGETGCVRLTGPSGDQGRVYLKNGDVYAVQAPGKRPSLGARLVSSSALSPAQLEEALEVQRTELQGWRLGELLVHLGLVERRVVEAFVLEQVRDGLGDLARWPHGAWRFRKGERTRDDVAPAQSVEVLLGVVEERLTQWTAVTRTVSGATAVPVLAAGGVPDGDLVLGQDAYALLCKVDGEKDLAELARTCGYTLFEAGQVVEGLVRAGLLEIDDEAADDEAPFEGGEPDDEFAASVARVSQALSALLGPRDEQEAADPFALPEPRRAPGDAVAAPTADDPEARRRAAARQASAAELASAHALALDVRETVLPGSLLVPPVEPARSTAPVPVPTLAPDDAAELAAERRAAEEARQQAEQRAREEAERRAAEEARAEAERRAAEEAARAEAERLAAEEAARRQAEQRAREEAERRAAEEARAEAERRAAEEAARLQAERHAREQAERRAAEEAARRQAEQRARAEAERRAAEEAERRAAEAEQHARAEAERRAAEEAARIEAEQHARQEAERQAQEQEEARRQAAEQEARAARVEAERRAAEEAAARRSVPAAGGSEARAASLALLTQLSDEPAAQPAAPAAPPLPPVPAPDLLALDGADKASLLRELASLGLDDDEPAPAGPPAPRAAPRPAAAAQPAKKKRGFFGLG